MTNTRPTPDSGVSLSRPRHLIYASGMKKNHPAIQPVLGQSNVKMIVNHLKEFSCPPLRDDITGPDRGVFRDGFQAGITEAVGVIEMMWQAAEIAASAAADEIADQLDHPTPSLDLLDELGDIAAALLDVKERLDQLDQDEDSDHADHCASCREMSEG